MTEDRDPQSQSMGPTPSTPPDSAAGAARQRKKRKWDQPAESLISAGIGFPGVLPLGVGNIVGISLPAIAPLSGAVVTNPVAATGASVPQIFQVPTIQQNTATIVQKLNQPKIQDELIAREIVINDSEPTIRYKLTKRQTQEEIQKCTGAVVITRGKYRPPNGPPDSEKPLYLHISAGAHLKDTAERIIAVDCAAAMVEEILKQGQISKPASTPFLSVVNISGQATQSLSTCLFLGFDTDPSLNIAARIRGPNDQYINHIMNETGASVILRGRGSGNLESPHGEEIQQTLHLYLSSTNPKSLEDAKLLAENLLDTISVECGASRVSSCNVYNAVPPPQQLSGIQSSTLVQNVIASPVASTACSTIASASVVPFVTTTIAPISSTTSVVSSACPQGTVPQSGVVFNYGQPQANRISYPQPSVPGGTSYIGYGGIYPQATPLQQVALALRQAPSPMTSVIAPTTSAVSTLPKMSSSSTTETDKRPPQKRKFQELPIASKEPASLHQNSRQGSEFLKPGVPYEDFSLRNVSTMPPPKKLIQSTSNGMPPPPPPRAMPPPPPKSPSSPSPPPIQEADSENIPKGLTTDTLSDTLVKLVEYGEEDDDAEVTGEEYPRSNLGLATAAKPFWAV
ncbi:protein RIK isoform X2 [Magnolia sinica]|uniref:protein RIK isoform X2 n=1 Tax=Magnolia sinica TaxID=86752 RepID=UPI002658EF84|nr:protein RIK isoform X2 [Magnolia sinica]